MLSTKPLNALMNNGGKCMMRKNSLSWVAFIGEDHCPRITSHGGNQNGKRLCLVVTQWSRGPYLRWWTAIYSHWCHAGRNGCHYWSMVAKLRQWHCAMQTQTTSSVWILFSGNQGRIGMFSSVFETTFQFSQWCTVSERLLVVLLLLQMIGSFWNGIWESTPFVAKVECFL